MSGCRGFIRGASRLSPRATGLQPDALPLSYRGCLEGFEKKGAEGLKSFVRVLRREVARLQPDALHLDSELPGKLQGFRGDVGAVEG